MKAIALCGRKNIAVHDHHYDQCHLEQPRNHGNFHALLSLEWVLEM